MTCSIATAGHALGVLRRVFEHAVRDGVIQRNPAAGIRLSKVQGNDPRPLTHDELWRLAGVVDAARDKLLVLVAGYCGLRWGELAASQWSDERSVWRDTPTFWATCDTDNPSLMTANAA